MFHDILDQINSAFEAETKPKKRPKTHDYRNVKFGHSYRITRVDGHIIDICGWGTGLSVRDYIIFKNDKRETRYRITKLRYESEDYWVGQAIFSPRKKW